MITSKPIDLSFVAGFLEGDGCISAKINPASDHRHGYRIRIIVSFAQSMRNRPILEHVQKILGGYGSLQDYPGHEKGLSELVIRSKSEVREVLESLLPYLQMKRLQAQHGIKILDLIPLRHYSTKSEFLKAVSLAEKMRTLNYRTGLKANHSLTSIKAKLDN